MVAISKASVHSSGSYLSTVVKRLATTKGLAAVSLGLIILLMVGPGKKYLSQNIQSDLRSRSFPDGQVSTVSTVSTVSKVCTLYTRYKK